MTNHLRSAAAGAQISLDNGRKARHAVAAFVVEATDLYRLGGFLAIVLGLSTSVITYQFRRRGR